MKTLFRRTIMAGAAMLALPLLAAAPARAATELRIMWYSDANEGDVMRDLLDRFEKANPDIKVVLDRVPYKTITDNLPALVSSGQAPDMARVTDLGGQSSYYLNLTPYLKDKAYWETNFKDVLPWVRPAGETDGVYGLMTQLTITMPIVNETLFQQAGIPLPGPTATWDDWAKAAKAVATKLNVPIPIAIDRSGHRIAGPAISYGAKFFSADTPALLEELIGKLEALDALSLESIEGVFKAICEEKGIKLGGIGPAVRLALSGTTASPGIFEMILVLGLAETRKRLERAIASIRG